MLRVSRSGYYRFIQEKPSKRRQENERLLFKLNKSMQEVGKFMVAGVFEPNYVLEVRAAHVSGFAA